MNIFKKLLALWIWLMLIVCASPASFAYDFQRSVSHAYDGMIEFVSGYDVDAVLTKTESAQQSAGARSLFVNIAGFLAAEDTGAADTFYHYSQTEIPAGQGLTVNSGVTSVGDLTAQQAMLKLGIPPPTYVYPVTLDNPLEHLTIDLGTPSPNTLPSWTVIRQTPPGSVGPPVLVPRGN